MELSEVERVMEGMLQPADEKRKGMVRASPCTLFELLRELRVYAIPPLYIWSNASARQRGKHAC